jgi:hypothetical protein
MKSREKKISRFICTALAGVIHLLRMNKDEVSHINAPFRGDERSALETVAQREGRSLGQQIRIFAIIAMRNMGALPPDSPLTPVTGRRKRA